MEKEGLKEIVSNVSENVYKDVLHKPLVQVGDAMDGLLKMVFLPFKCLGMTADELEIKYKNFISKTLKKIPKDKVVKPQACIVCPLLDHVKYVFNDETLSNMFSELLASSLDVNKVDDVHPSFVHILKQMSNFDATVIKLIYDKEFYRFPYVNLEVRNIYNKHYNGITFLNTEYNFPLELTKQTTEFLSKIGIIDIQLNKQYIQEDYYYEVNRDFLHGNMDYSFDVSSMPLLTQFIKRCAEFNVSNYKYQRIYDDMCTDYFRFPEFTYFNIEISKYTEKLLADIVKTEGGLSKNYLFIPQRGNMVLNNYGRNFIKCCVSNDNKI